MPIIMLILAKHAEIMFLLLQLCNKQANDKAIYPTTSRNFLRSVLSGLGEAESFLT